MAKAPKTRKSIPGSLSQSELAPILGIGTRQIRNLEEAGVLLPVIVEGGRKRYPFPESNHRYIAFKVQESRRGSAAKMGKEEVDLRRSEVALAKEELELAEKLETMVHVDDVERLVAEPLRVVYAMLKNLPARWGPELVGCTSTQEAIGRLKPAVAELLEVLRKAADGLDDGAGDRAA